MMVELKTVDLPESERAFVTIPIIEIVPGWSVESIETLEECDDAHVKIMALIAEIEYQIDMHDARFASDRDYEWLARAKKALKFKKAAAQCVNNARARIARAGRKARQESTDQRLLNLIRTEVSTDQFKKWVSMVSFNADQDSDDE